uniref:sodium-dependent neutral amino acid transporter B(0)AT1-like isoform X2 n=1 Tax=Myxine glutinosa TaxID=7769 RepID=UPI00358FF541
MVVHPPLSDWHCVIITWITWYLLHSFEYPMPWGFCPLNENDTEYLAECRLSSPVNYFWYRKTLDISTNINEGGTVKWWLLICHIFVWSVIYCCTIRGIESTGKVVYITTPIPYIILFCFLVQGLTLEGSTDGLRYLFTPDMTQLQNPKVWMDAATQIFFSVGLGFGAVVAFSSYNNIHNNCEGDALFLSLVNSLTSVFIAIPIFSVLGFKATITFNECLDRNVQALMNEFDVTEGIITRDNYEDQLNFYNASFPKRILDLKLATCDLSELLNTAVSGTGLIFIVFTEAINNMPVPQLWSILFFVMLFSVGLSSMFGNLEGVLTPLTDLGVFPKSMSKEMVQGMVCLLFMLISMIFITAPGNYWLTIFNDYVCSVPLLFTCFLEIISVMYIYGYKRFREDLEFMLKRKPNPVWIVMWGFISPAVICIILVAYIIVESQNTLEYEAWDPSNPEFPDKLMLEYPTWVVAILSLLSALPCACVPVIAIYKWITSRYQKDKNEVQDIVIGDISVVYNPNNDNDATADNDRMGFPQHPILFQNITYKPGANEF